MDIKENIKSLIYEFWEKEIEDLKLRIFSLEKIESDLINNIVGVRRSGKTYFMFLIREILKEKYSKENFIYLNFENRRIKSAKLEDLNYIIEFIHQEELLKRGRVFLMLDEIQHVKGWEIFARSVYDEFKDKIKLIVSGSIKSLISKDYGKLLTGRHLSIEIFPLNFKEFLIFKDFKTEKLTEEKISKIKKFVEEFLEGSFPRYVLKKEKFWIEETFEDIIEKDVKSRVEIRKKEVIDDLVNILLQRVCSRISFTKIKNILKNKGFSISTDLVIRYFKILEDVFLFFSLPIYSTKYSEIIKNPKKNYVVDNSFLTIYPLNLSKNLGMLMENCVFNEFLKFGKKAGKDLFYLKINNGEIDFVIKEGLNIKQLIQVTYASSKDEINQREIKALEKAYELFKKDRPELIIITWDYEDILKRNNLEIKCIPLWKWLLKIS